MSNPIEMLKNKVQSEVNGVKISEEERYEYDSIVESESIILVDNMSEMFRYDKDLLTRVMNTLSSNFECINSSLYSDLVNSLGTLKHKSNFDDISKHTIKLDNTFDGTLNSIIKCNDNCTNKELIRNLYNLFYKTDKGRKSIDYDYSAYAVVNIFISLLYMERCRPNLAYKLFDFPVYQLMVDGCYEQALHCVKQSLDSLDNSNKITPHFLGYPFTLSVGVNVFGRSKDILIDDDISGMSFYDADEVAHLSFIDLFKYAKMSSLPDNTRKLVSVVRDSEFHRRVGEDIECYINRVSSSFKSCECTNVSTIPALVYLGVILSDGCSGVLMSVDCIRDLERNDLNMYLRDLCLSVKSYENVKSYYKD